MISISRISDPDEIKRVLPVISSAWGMPNLSAAFKDTINAMRFHGGLVCAAYDGVNMIGMQFSFPGYRHGKTYLYSHMTGIVEDKKYSGIGYQLKMFQQKWALENGYDLIAWTFDPIRSMNAYFNLKKLGAITRTIIPNFYGTMEDSLNAGIPTDRVVAEWWIKEKKLQPDMSNFIIVDVSKHDVQQYMEEIVNLQPKVVKVSIPFDFTSIMSNDLSRAVRIKNALSTVLTKLFSMHYSAVDFEKAQSSSMYILSTDPPLKGGDPPNPFV